MMRSPDAGGRRMRRPIRLWALLIVSLALAGCGGQRGVSPAADNVAVDIPPGIAVESRMIDRGGGLPAPGDPAPDFVFTFAGGETRRLSDLRGLKVVLNFWATWCAPCEEEMPDLQQIDARDDVVVLGVNRLELPEVIVPFAREHDLTFTLIANPAGDIAERYGAKNLPTSYFINSDGTINHRQVGIMSLEMMQEQVERLR